MIFLKKFIFNFSLWKFSNYSFEHFKDVNDYLSLSDFEEFADSSLPIYTQTDVYFYWYSNWNCFYNLKLFFKIKKSVKLRVPYFKFYFSNKYEFFELNSNYLLLTWRKKLIWFLNYWGRVKRFFYSKPYMYLYFYKYYHYNKLHFFFWRSKFCDVVLKTEAMHNFFIFSSKSFFYVSLYDSNYFTVNIKFFNEFNIQKAVRLWSWKASIRSFPHSKIKRHLQQYFSNVFWGWQKLNLKKNFFFFNNLFVIIKSFSIRLGVKKNLLKWLLFFICRLDDCNLSILQWNYLFLILLLIFSFMSQNIINNTNLFLIFFFLLWLFFCWFIKDATYPLFAGEVFYLRFAKIFLAWKILFINGTERFIKSYIFNYQLKLVKYVFYQGYTKKLDKNFFFYPLELPLFINLNFIVQYFERHWWSRKAIDWIDITLKKNFLVLPLKRFLFSWLKLFLLFMWEWKKITTNYFISQFWSSLGFFLTTMGRFRWNFLKEFWTLNLISNLAILFNKNLHLDTVSSIAIGYFFSNCSTYNYKFFIWLNFESIYPSIEEFFLLPLKLEFVFFTKGFVYKSNYDLFDNLVLFFYFYLFVANNIRISQSKRFFLKVHPKWWFEYEDFMEELFHLSLTYISEDVERAQEFVWTKQLSELWLEKLTDYLKEMRLKKIEVGNVQYSPDFTQEHEFGLVLKWGLELETLKKTRFIILKRFHGTWKKIFKGNYISKKIDFLHKFWKFKQISHIETWEVLMNNLYLNWSDVNLLINWLMEWRLDLLTKWNFVEMTRLSLATLVAVNRACYKYSYDQLDTMLLNFPISAERTVKEIYNFVLLSFDWTFFTDTYNKYYSQKIVKRRIWFFKMIRKKVYQKFMENWNLFFLLADLKNSFNYSLFLAFRWLRSWINKVVKNKFFFTMLFSVIFKNNKSFFMPTWESRNDYQLYIYQWNNIFPAFGVKYLIISNHINFTWWFQKFFLPDELFNLMLQDSIDLEQYYKFIALPTFLLNFNFKDFYYFLAFNLPGINLNQLLNQVDVEAIFQNFFSEFFYDLYANFFKNLQQWIILSKKRNTIWLNNFNIYQNSIKNSFSVSFFYYFNSKLFRNSKLFWQHFIYFLNSFFVSSLKKDRIKEFCDRFKDFFFSTSQLKISLNLRHLLFMDLLIWVIKKFFLDKKFWRWIILSFFFRLQKLSNLENLDMTLKSIFFNYACLTAYLYHIEIFFINFLVKLMKEMFWK